MSYHLGFTSATENDQQREVTIMSKNNGPMVFSNKFLKIDDFSIQYISFQIFMHLQNISQLKKYFQSLLLFHFLVSTLFFNNFRRWILINEMRNSPKIVWGLQRWLIGSGSCQVSMRSQLRPQLLWKLRHITLASVTPLVGKDLGETGRSLELIGQSA